MLKLIWVFAGRTSILLIMTARLVINPIIVDGCASLFNCTGRFGPETQWPSPCKTLTSGLGLDLSWCNYWLSFTLAHSIIGNEYSSLFVIVIVLVFMFSLWCVGWVGGFCAAGFLCVSVLRVASGPRMKLAGCWGTLGPHPGGCSADRSRAVVPVLVLLFVALWFILF